MDLQTTFINSVRRLEVLRTNTPRVSKKLIDSAQAELPAVLLQLNTTVEGLSEEEATERLEQFGSNEVAKEKRQSPLARLWDNVKNPLVILLLLLALVSYLTGDLRATTVMIMMVVLGVVLRYVQEMRADNSAEKLRAMVKTTATVARQGIRHEVPLRELVPGDVVLLSAGDMVPADVRLLSAKDLFLNQASLTGESMPVEKVAGVCPAYGA